MRLSAVLRTVILLLITTGPALGDGIDTLVEEALQENPGLAAREAAVTSLQHAASVAGAWPDPMIALEYSNASAATLGLSDHPMSGLQIRISQTLKPIGWSQLRHDLGLQQAQIAELQRQEAALQLQAFLRQTWWLLTRSRLMEALTQEHLDRTTELLASARSRYETGAIGQHALLRLEVRRDQLADELQDHQTTDRALTAALGEALGGNLDRTYTTPASISALPPPQQDWVTLAMEHRPLLQAIQQRQGTAQTTAALARLEARPTPSLWAGYRVRTVQTESDPGTDLISLGVSIPVPVSSTRRAAGQEAAALEGVREAEHDWLATLNDINAEMTTVAANWQRSHDKATRYEEQLLPGARATLQSARSDFSVGRADFASLFEAEVTLLELERAWLSAATQTHILHATATALLGVAP